MGDIIASYPCYWGAIWLSHSVICTPAQLLTSNYCIIWIQWILHLEVCIRLKHWQLGVLGGVNRSLIFRRYYDKETAGDREGFQYSSGIFTHTNTHTYINVYNEVNVWITFMVHSWLQRGCLILSTMWNTVPCCKLAYFLFSKDLWDITSLSRSTLLLIVSNGSRLTNYIIWNSQCFFFLVE